MHDALTLTQAVPSKSSPPAKSQREPTGGSGSGDGGGEGAAAGGGGLAAPQTEQPSHNRHSQTSVHGFVIWLHHGLQVSSLGFTAKHLTVMRSSDARCEQVSVRTSHRGGAGGTEHTSRIWLWYRQTSQPSHIAQWHLEDQESAYSHPRPQT